MSDSPSNFFSALSFPDSSKSEWKAKVLKDLKGKDYESLFWKTDEGLQLEPMYFQEDLQQLNTLQNLHNINANDNPAFANRHWTNFEKVLVSDSNKANQEALTALENGADGIEFHLHGKAELGLLLNGIMPQYCALSFYGIANNEQFISELKNWLSKQNIDQTLVNIFIDHDPMADFLKGKERHFEISSFAKLLQSNEKAGGLKTFTLDMGIYQNAGADAIQQLGIGIHHLVAYLDKGTDAGLSAATIFDNLMVKSSIGNEYFIEIAKLRALKALIAKIASSYDIENYSQTIHAYSSVWSKSFYDPYVNMLRNTTEAMSAIIGGADSISISPYDEGLAEPSAFSKRITRNISLILQEESYLGKVADPVAGSYYIETLTAKLIEGAWELFLDLEDRGTFEVNATSGYLLSLVTDKRNKKLEKVASRKTTFIGTNQFPNPTDSLEKVLKPEWMENTDSFLPRHAALQFEALRHQMESKKAGGKIPKAVILPLSNGFMPSARINFSQAFFGTIGIPLMALSTFSKENSINELKEHNPDLVILCGSDEDYIAMGESVAENIKNIGTAKIVIAGNPVENADKLRVAGVDYFIHAKSNVINSLSQIIETLD
ncbi:methylmalonyl-CoA mutase family protein [Fulvivirgaceae bacterium LMO-SS25]